MVTAADALRSFVAAVDAEGLGVHGVEIRVGQEHAAHRWRSDDRENLYSVSKGVCALAAAIAVDEGVLTLDLGVAVVTVTGHEEEGEDRISALAAQVAAPTAGR